LSLAETALCLAPLIGWLGENVYRDYQRQARGIRALQQKEETKAENVKVKKWKAVQM
jgi:hypothetical protein